MTEPRDPFVQNMINICEEAQKQGIDETGVKHFKTEELDTTHADVSMEMIKQFMFELLHTFGLTDQQINDFVKYMKEQ